MSEEIPSPNLALRILLLSLYVGMMVLAGFLGLFLGLVPPARRAELSPLAHGFYGLWVWVAEFKVALLVHLRCGQRRVAAVRCPRCQGPITARFDPSGLRLSLTCPGWHAWSSVPVLVAPPSWWHDSIERPWWGDDPVPSSPSGPDR